LLQSQGTGGRFDADMFDGAVFGVLIVAGRV
jgi:hypothetical protein